MSQVLIYSADWCKYCQIAKRTMDTAGIEYQEIDVDSNDLAGMFLQDNGFKTIPVLLVDGDKFYKGNEGLKEYMNGL